MRTAVIMMALLMLPGCAPTDYCTSTSGAELMAEQEIANRTRNPKRAKFRDVRATSVGSCKFKVTGRVEAENGFGALLEEPFKIDLEWDGAGSYIVSGVEIGERPPR